MSRKHNIEGSLNRAFNELSIIRKTLETTNMKNEEYQRLLDVFKVAGKIRELYLVELEKKNAA